MGMGLSCGPFLHADRRCRPLCVFQKEGLAGLTPGGHLMQGLGRVRATNATS